MEIYRKLLELANQNFKTADHMIYVTYPIINDPKLAFTIIERLYNTLIYGISAILNYDYLYKRISTLPENDEDKIKLFKEFTILRYNFNREILVLIKELKELLNFRNKSPMEFIRKENFVICNSRYNTKTINIRKIKYYVSNIRSFIEKVNRVLKNGF